MDGKHFSTICSILIPNSELTDPTLFATCLATNKPVVQNLAILIVLYSKARINYSFTDEFFSNR